MKLAVVAVAAFVGTATAEPRPAPPHRPGSANDDLPHRTKEMRARLARAQTCVPRAVKASPGDVALDDAISLLLDSDGAQLVVCAQAPTRRQESVFFDQVSYACWNVDPRTAV